MRRLPIYLLLDTSDSMSGEPIAAVETGLQSLVHAWQKDPYMIETAFLSVITFGGSAQQIMPLTDLTSFEMPKIKASGMNALGDALKTVSQCIDRDVVKTTAEIKGDWKPFVLIFIFSNPVDDWQSGLNELKKRTTTGIVIITIGNEANESILKQITENIGRMETDLEGLYKIWYIPPPPHDPISLPKGVDSLLLPPPPEGHFVI